MKRLSHELIARTQVYVNEPDPQAPQAENPQETHEPKHEEQDGADDEKPRGEPETQRSCRPEGPNILSSQDDHIMKKLRTIHANLGHPSNQVLHRTLKEAGASPEVLQKALTFECIHCARRGHAAPHRTSQIPQAQAKWEVVSVDTFWWHSPHKDPTGNPREHVVGISFMDEASDYHLAAIVRSGTKKQGSIRSEEFRNTFSRDWLRILLKPESLRFDDEGSFRDQRLIQWLEAQAIRISVIAGEAAWQVGKHSRHLEVLKENMSLLASELGPEVSAEELLSLSLAAKNEMHSLKGYSPNQWVFGQHKNRIQSYLQHGNHLPTSSVRNNSETFEEALQRSNAARQTFLKADSRRRVLRAARGHARKTQEFEMGQLVYFYRKGRNNTSKHEAGWHGPARVVAIEKQGDGQQNQTQGSVIWIVHATILYRCAPEQLRHVPVGVQGAFRELNGDSSPLQSLQQAGNRANYRDISQDLSRFWHWGSRCVAKPDTTMMVSSPRPGERRAESNSSGSVGVTPEVLQAEVSRQLDAAMGEMVGKLNDERRRAEEATAEAQRLRLELQTFESRMAADKPSVVAPPGLEPQMVTSAASGRMVTGADEQFAMGHGVSSRIPANHPLPGPMSATVLQDRGRWSDGVCHDNQGPVSLEASLPLGEGASRAEGVDPEVFGPGVSSRIPENHPLPGHGRNIFTGRSSGRSQSPSGPRAFFSGLYDAYSYPEADQGGDHRQWPGVVAHGVVQIICCVST